MVLVRPELSSVLFDSETVGICSARLGSLNKIADMPALVQVVQGLEGIVNGSHPSAA
jgi:hypothetical protein